MTVLSKNIIVSCYQKILLSAVINNPGPLANLRPGNLLGDLRHCLRPSRSVHLKQADHMYHQKIQCTVTLSGDPCSL